MLEKYDIGLSFLDVLTCALGGVILLFVIFTALNHKGVDRPSVHEPIDMVSMVGSVSSMESGEHNPDEIPQLFILTVFGDAEVLLAQSGKTIDVTKSVQNNKSIWQVFVPNPVEADSKKLKFKGVSQNTQVQLVLAQPFSKKLDPIKIEKQIITPNTKLVFSAADGWRLN